MVLKKIQLLNSTYAIIDNALRQQIANRYNENISYFIGDFCIYNNKLYKCIEDTQGEWNLDCWEQKRIIELGSSGSVIYYIDSVEQEESKIIERTISEITHSAQTIRNYAFYNYTSLQSVSFSNCTTIGNAAFYSCSSLQQVSFPNCSHIGDYAFYGCRLLQSVSFPNCSTIGSSAFQYCSSLQQVNFSNCSRIEYEAFYYCTSLQSVSFPNCSTIGQSAFAYCSSLQSVNFPNCSRIGYSTFQYCSSLQLVNFPNCSYIGYGAFRSCSSLQSIYLLSTSVCTLANTNAFQSTPISNSTYIGKFGSIYVPSSLVSVYKTATNWASYSSRITSYVG